MTLRLALKALESTGYIVTTRGSRGGSRVADADSLSRCWNQWMHEHAGELDDIFEFRATIESKLAALAAERRTEEDLQAMERAVGGERQPQDWSSLFRTDIDIHRTIARAARSPRLERAMMAARGDLFVPIDLDRLEKQAAPGARQPPVDHRGDPRPGPGDGLRADGGSYRLGRDPGRQGARDRRHSDDAVGWPPQPASRRAARRRQRRGPSATFSYLYRSLSQPGTFHPW